eukprot:1872850-Pyramimonas_sp.AAC.2
MRALLQGRRTSPGMQCARGGRRDRGSARVNPRGSTAHDPRRRHKQVRGPPAEVADDVGRVTQVAQGL